MKTFFSKLFSIFKKAWFWWLFGLIVLTLLIWFVLPALKIGSMAPFASAAVRLSLILLFVIAWAIINIILARRAKREEDEEGEQTDPEKVKRALAALRLSFANACNILAQGIWGNRLVKKNAYALPWYITLGAAKSGRSSLLRQSDLPYPIANESYQQIEQGDDELCQFWFSKDAVIIDTQENLFTETTEDSVPQRVWKELLKLLKQYRRKQPLNGVILSIDIKDLLLKNDKQRAIMAHNFRLQLQTLNDTLGIQCPIYICFTKSDLVTGFDEFFGHLNTEQRQQVFGFTLAYSKLKDSITFFDREYDALIERLKQQLIEQLHAEKDSKKAVLVEILPLQMASIKVLLKQFLLDVFESNHYQQPHVTRGVFFTSCLQQGAPIDCLIKTSKDVFGIDVVTEQEKKGERSYFIHDMFNKIIFPEKNILLFNANQQKRQDAWRYFSYASAGFAILLFIYIWGHSFVLNKEQLQQVQQSITEFQSVPGNTKEKNQQLLYVLPMLDELHDMRTAFDPANDPRSMRWGLYQGNKIDAVAEEMYRQNLIIHFVPYIVDTAVSELKDINTPPNQQYNALRVYLMLANPDKMSKPFMENWLNTYWKATYKEQPRILNSLETNLTALLNMKIKPITVDSELVKQTRIKLRHTSQAQRDYFELQELAGGSKFGMLYISNGVNLDFNRVFGARNARLGVPALYSFKGYNDSYKTQLQKVIENEGYSNWILGEYAEKTLSDGGASPDIALQVRSFYMRDYIKYWTKILEGLKIANFDTLSDASAILRIISGGSSPIYDVLKIVNENTVLNPAASKSGGNALANTQKFMKQNKALVKAVQPKAIKKFTSKGKKFVPKNKKGKGSVEDIESPTEKTPVGIHFEKLNALMQSSGEKESGTPLDKIMETLSLLNSELSDINTSSNSKEKAYQFVMKRLGKSDSADSGEGEASSEDPITLLQQQAKAAPEPLKGWLNAIAANTWSALLSSARDYISTQYQAQLLPDYRKLIVGQFPFYKNAKTQISLSAFSEFFEPDGKMDSFFNKYLRVFVDTNQQKWKWKKFDGKSLPIAESSLLQFQRAETLKNAFFKAAGEPPKVEYELTVSSLNASLKSAKLQLNNKTLDYRHGPKRAVSFTWPEAGSKDIYRLTLSTLNNATTRFSEKGDWGPFALFNKGRITTKSRSSDLLVRFSSKGRSVSYWLKTESLDNPFSPALLPKFRLANKLEK